MYREIELIKSVESMADAVTDVMKEKYDEPGYWEKLRHQAMIAAMPIANHVIDGLYGGNYHSEKLRAHTIDAFVDECEAIADAMIEKMKKG